MKAQPFTRASECLLQLAHLVREHGRMEDSASQAYVLEQLANIAGNDLEVSLEALAGAYDFLVVHAVGDSREVKSRRWDCGEFGLLLKTLGIVPKSQGDGILELWERWKNSTEPAAQELRPMIEREYRELRLERGLTVD